MSRAEAGHSVTGPWNLVRVAVIGGGGGETANGHEETKSPTRVSEQHYVAAGGFG